MNSLKIIICGPPSGGKSSLAEILSKKYKLTKFDIPKIIEWGEQTEDYELAQEIRQKKAEEISKLIETKQLGSEPYQRLTTLMQIGTKDIWFKPETESQKEKIIDGFKELYQHNRIINCTKEDLSNIFLNTTRTYH